MEARAVPGQLSYQGHPDVDVSPVEMDDQPHHRDSHPPHSCRDLHGASPSVRHLSGWSLNNSR